MKRSCCLLGLILSSCIVVEARRPLPPAPPPIESGTPVPEETVYVPPPIEAPPPIAVRCAPPPMRVEEPPPPPYAGAFWVGGYWHWGDGEWVWFGGRWMLPPRPEYAWFAPYYENRNGLVIYVGGHWGHAGVAYVPPAQNVYIPVHESRPGYVGYPPQGPQGVFVPPPPGSRTGVIVPAPIGTPPSVVVHAPPVIRPGMTIQPSNVPNGFNTPNARNVTIIAPPGVTRTGQPVQTTIQAQAHAAAPTVMGVPQSTPTQFQRGPTDAPHGGGQAGFPVPPSNPTNSSIHPQYPLSAEHSGEADHFAQPMPPSARPVPAAPNPGFHPDQPGRFDEHSNQPDRFVQPMPPTPKPANMGAPPMNPSLQAPPIKQVPPVVDVRRNPPQPVARTAAPVEQQRGQRRQPSDEPGKGFGKEKKERGEKEDRSAR